MCQGWRCSQGHPLARDWYRVGFICSYLETHFAKSLKSLVFVLNPVTVRAWQAERVRKKQEKCITGYELRPLISLELFSNLAGNSLSLSLSPPPYFSLSLSHHRDRSCLNFQRTHSCEHWQVEDRGFRWPFRQEFPQRHHCLRHRYSLWLCPSLDNKFLSLFFFFLLGCLILIWINVAQITILSCPSSRFFIHTY